MNLSRVLGNISLAEGLLLSALGRAGSGERLISSLLAPRFSELCEALILSRAEGQV